MNVYDFEVELNGASKKNMSDYRDKVLLVVNTASACGFTPQYAGLEDLYRSYKDKGFEVLAFPCNQFGKQESGSDDEIKSFCDLKFKISFALFKKVNVNGSDAHPLFTYLKKKSPGLLGTEAIKWNFTKFLVDREGNVVKRFAPKDKPEDLTKDIEKLL